MYFPLYETKIFAD